MRTHVVFKQVTGLVAALTVVAAAATGCNSDSSSPDGGFPAGTGTIADAEAQVEEYTGNPPLEVSPLPSKPDGSTYAIQLNCTIPACAPGAMQPAMDALGWKFEVQTYDIAKGPVAGREALAQAIAKKPDVILLGLNYPAATIKEEVDAAIAQGIKLIGIGGTENPAGFSACIQCTSSAEALGALGANIALADAGKKTDLAVLFDKTVPALVSEADGVKKEVAKNGEGSAVVDIEQSISATPADNAAAVVSLLQRNPKVKYLMLTSPQFDPTSALKAAGLNHVKVVGLYPYSDVEVSAVKEGRILAYAVGELGALYWRAADAAARAMQDVAVDPDEPIQVMRVMNSDNADLSLLDPTDYQDVFTTAWQLQ